MEAKLASALLTWNVSSRKDVALARMMTLGCCGPDITADLQQRELFEAMGNEGLVGPLTVLLADAYESWRESIRRQCAHCVQGESFMEEKKDDDAPPEVFALKISRSIETDTLRQALVLHTRLCQLDATLAEEMSRAGSHAVLSRLIRFGLEGEVAQVVSASYDIVEEDSDVVMELQDLACEIGSLCGGSFPMRVSPFTVEELRARLPLNFSVSSVDDSNDGAVEVEKVPQHILIHQVTARQGAQEDVGFVLWPSAVALSSWVATNPDCILGNSVLELGAGCGLTGLAAAAIAADAKGIESNVILTDFNGTVLQNADGNIRLNGLETIASTAKLDFYAQNGDNHAGGWIDGSGISHDPVDVILAADVICKPEDAVAAANTIYNALRAGGTAIVISADAKHRFGVDRFNNECCRVGLDVEVANVADLYNGALLSSTQGLDGKRGIEQTSGYVEGMTLTMFTVRKPELNNMLQV